MNILNNTAVKSLQKNYLYFSILEFDVKRQKNVLCLYSIILQEQ